MIEIELQRVVDTIVARTKKRAKVFTSTNAIIKHACDPELDISGPMASIHQKRFPASCLSIVEPLLHIKDGSIYKYAIDIVGRMKGAGEEASAAIEAAWKRSWEHHVPQACIEAFRALLRIGDNDARLLVMVKRTMKVDNYGLHNECAKVLMQIEGGYDMLVNWKDTIPGQCECQLHRKLAAKIEAHIKNT